MFQFPFENSMRQNSGQPIVPKNKNILLRIFLVSLFLLPWPIHAAFGFKLDGTLDKEAISNAYFEGEFSRVLPPLEAYRSSFPGNATKEDSIFVYKYLSVIYAADLTKRQRAESYMVQLIKLMPTIELIDLYISDNIESIFKNVKQNYAHQKAYVQSYDEYGRSKKPINDSGHQGSEIKKTHSNLWIWWVIGGAGSAVIVAAAYFAVNSNPKAVEKSIISKP